MRYTAILKTGAVDVRPVIERGQAAGIGLVATFESAIGDRMLQNSGPDCVIAVLEPAGLGEVVDPATAGAFTNLDVMLRVGLCLERKIPVLLIAPPPLLIPTGPPSLMAASCSLMDSQNLDLHLQAFVALLPEPSPTDHRSARVQHGRLSRLVKAFKASQGTDSSPDQTSLELETLVFDLLQKTAGHVVRRPALPDEGFDLAVLPSRSTDDFVLVEIKAGRLDERRLHDAELRLREQVIGRGCRLGLLIYYDRAGRDFPVRHMLSQVVRFELEEFASRLDGQPFLELLSEEASKISERT